MRLLHRAIPILLLGFSCAAQAQQKPPPKIIRVGAPMPDSIKPEKKQDTLKPIVEKVGSYTLIRLPPKAIPPPSKVKTTDTPPAVNATPKATYGSMPAVQVSIRLMENRVSRLQDVIVYITLTNKARYAQELLFDKPFRPGYGPWNTDCYVRRGGEGLNKITNRGVLDSNRYSKEYLVTKKTAIMPSQWIMKGYALPTLVKFGDETEKTQHLPPGEYELQVSYMGVMSNTVTFYMR